MPPQNTHEIFRKELELFDKEFPCPHHPAQCNGKCNNKLKSFLRSALQSQRTEMLKAVEELGAGDGTPKDDTMEIHLAMAHQDGFNAALTAVKETLSANQ